MDRRLSFLTESRERALLLGIFSKKKTRVVQEISLEELVGLAETAGALIQSKRLLELRQISPATYLGKGTAESLGMELQEQQMDVLIFDEDLSPTQTRNLEKILGVKVIDRTGLILDIFARRARTQEGKLQVELAQLNYLLPRLVGRGRELSQLAGGIGTRGPGETKLEMDRRKARNRISIVKRELKRVQSSRELHRERRGKIPIATVALVGYTNAGKSTLMNRLTRASVLVEDKLFATLDPTTRRLKLPSGREILLSDTVGFVRKLPHELVESFRATFEEVEASDLLLHVIDASHPHATAQSETVNNVLKELSLDRIPRLSVYNKMDALGNGHGDGDGHHDHFREPGIPISSLTGEGIDSLLIAIDERLSETHRMVSLKIPHEAGSDLSLLYRTSRILKRHDQTDGVQLEAVLDQKHYNKFRHYEC